MCQKKLWALRAAEATALFAELPVEHAAARILGEFEARSREKVEEGSVDILEVSLALPGVSIHLKEGVV
jgi:hypothetical protein